MSKLDVSLRLFRIPSNSSCYVLVHVGISSDIFCLVFCPSWVWLITVLQCNARWAREAREARHWNRNNFDPQPTANEYLTVNRVKHKVRLIKYPEFFLLNLKMSCIFLMRLVISVLRLRYQDKIFIHFLTPADYSEDFYSQLRNRQLIHLLLLDTMYMYAPVISFSPENFPCFDA